MSLHRNVPTDAESKVDIARDEVVGEVDYYITDGTYHFLIIFFPGGYARHYQSSGKSGEESLAHFGKAFAFVQSMKKVCKVVTGDGECGFESITSDLLKDHDVTMVNLPRGKKPAGIERLNRTIGEHLDSYKHAMKHGRYAISIAGLLIAAAIAYIVMCNNILAKRANPGGVSPHYMWTGEPADGSKLLRHELFDLVLCPSESIEATAEKSVYCLALGPAKPHLNSRTHNYLNLETFEILKRDDAIKVEMTEKVASYINAQALDPNSPLYSKSLSKKHKKKAEKKPPGRPKKQPVALPNPDPISTMGPFLTRQFRLQI
jgi:hypothetical protein